MRAANLRSRKEDALGKLGADFGRFQSRMDDLAKHIGQVTKDVELVHTSSRKISDQFQKIKDVELDAIKSETPEVMALDVEPKPALVGVAPIAEQESKLL